MYISKKILVFILIFSVSSIKPAQVIVEVINNSSAGIKITYESENSFLGHSRPIEEFVSSKQTLTIPILPELHMVVRGGHATAKVLINTYKGPLNLLITTINDIIPVPGHIKQRSRFNPFGRHNAATEVPNFEIKAELSAQYPIGNASFQMGRPWDQYTIRVIIDEKQLENSKVSISYKPLEKLEIITPIPVTRPAPARRFRPGDFRQISRLEYEPAEGREEELDSNPLPFGLRYHGSFDEQGNHIN